LVSSQDDVRRIGDEDALAVAVEKFYEKKIAHEEVARFFEGVDMELETIQELGVASNVIGGTVAVVAPLRGIFEEQAKQRV
jgi:truncated hemoglobin YjbI